MSGNVLAQDTGTTETVVVKPQMTDKVLDNPGKGFMTFQRFNGDTANVLNNCCGNFREEFPFPVNRDTEMELVNEDYPDTKIAYFRFYWRYIEPQKGEYRWEIIDRALKTAHERGQTLMLSVMPYGSEGDEENDVPDWYREMVGEKTDWEYDNPVNKWLVDPEDARYIKYYGGLIRALGERYDGHPDLESVDARIVGAWGEGGGTELLTRQTMQALMDAYLESFRETSLVTLLHGEESVRYAKSQAEVGWRQDCLGDLGFWAEDEGDWTHMYDYYPQTTIDYGMEDAWKMAPVTFEICGTFTRWKEEEGYDLEDVKYIFDQALKWHMSSFNAKSSPVPEEWRPAVNEWLKQMGYRFALRRFAYPQRVAPGGKLWFTSWWENRGVAPIYRKYPLALRLQGAGQSTVLLTGADIREWMPGDNLYDGAVFIPRELPEGDYTLQVGLVEPLRELNEPPRPAVDLAIDGRTQEGWYSLGEITIKDEE
ncbi:Beta-galactosidase [Fodinibius roseus]|uniref:Beta-galactosidase n=1 Tax=Fodinibius roseus TaxID=1194090 RepID=A0A1M5DS20_9BACT|nr:DUF4832 domain-containing protein [Fodinibius roseus]SHF69818.1 Beta-galactosidase [Fodinibius roseus]